jgi:riboflavin kinase/FMN adenylyltransferase
VHLGHQEILAEVRRIATANGWHGTAYTFGIPPRAVQAASIERVLLLPWSVRERLIGRFVDRVEHVSFEHVHSLSPEAFVEILATSWNVRAVVVGEGFRFGAERRGDADTLRRLGERHGLSITVAPLLLVDDRPVSSTRIRRLVADGKIQEAAACLGRAPSLHGLVVPGDRIGRTLGFPTANLRVGRRILLPRFGVYLVEAACDGLHSHGLLYVGRRPTIAGVGDLRCEVHLLTPPPHDLTGKTMNVAILELLRGDLRLPSSDALRRQITRDVEQARERVASRPVSNDPIFG